MSNFEDAFSKAKDMAEVLGKKSAEALELSRLKINQAEAKNKLSRAYADLGRVYYEVLNGKPEHSGRKNAAVAEIDRQTKAIEALQKEMHTVQTMKKCTACGALSPKAADFCIKCGSRLDK